MDSAIQFFRAHPLNLLIGTAKAYRDFFIPNGNGIFSFYGSKTIWLDSSLWIASIILLFFGLFRAIKKFKDPIISLLLASFIGIFLSIPFLPPIDGGKRFYASTMPFFFALIALALPSIEIKKKIWIEDRKTGTALLSGLLALMTLIMPVTIIQLTSPPEITPASCPADQEPFAFHHDPNSYIDLIPSEETPCGQAPSVCFDVFLQNATERKYNLFFEELIKEAELQNGTTRILTANNLVQRGSAYFFTGSTTLLASAPTGEIISGRATPIPTKGYPTIYRIESISKQ